jgi:hypothetical protein
MIEVRVAVYGGLFALGAAVIGSLSSIATLMLTQGAQERQLRTQVQATAVESELVAFRTAVQSYLEQLTRVSDSSLKGSPEALRKELVELDRRAFSLGLFGTTELIKATGHVQEAVVHFTSGEPVVDPKDPRALALYKARTVWLTRARKEVLELRNITLGHKSTIAESTELLEKQMDQLMRR